MCPVSAVKAEEMTNVHQPTAVRVRKGTVAQRLLQSPCKVPKDLPFVCIWTLNDRVPNIQLCVLEVLNYPALCSNNSAHFIIMSSYLASSLPESGFYIWISSTVDCPISLYFSPCRFPNSACFTMVVMVWMVPLYSLSHVKVGELVGELVADY